MPSDVARFEWRAHTTRETDSNAIKLEKHRGVYWLLGTVTEPLNGVPLCPNPETASTAVEETAISATDSDTTAMQLEESEETRRHKHKTSPRNVNRDEHDARRIAYLQFRSRSGKAVDHAHKPQAGTHGSETKMGRDHFFLARAAVPQHVKAVLNRLETGAVFSAMSENGVEGGLVVALEAIKLTDRTRPIKRVQSRIQCATHRRRQVSMLEELNKRGMRLRNEPEP